MSRETRRSYTGVVRVALVVRSSGSVGTPMHGCEAMAKWLRGAAQVAVAVAKWLKKIRRNVQWGPTAHWPGCVGPMSWSRVGPHVAALAWSMTNVFDVTPGEVYWAASEMGWTVGHSYSVYAPFVHGCTTLRYEGTPVGTPDAGAFWRVIADHGVSVLLTAPTAFRQSNARTPTVSTLPDMT